MDSDLPRSFSHVSVEFKIEILTITCAIDTQNGTIKPVDPISEYVFLKDKVLHRTTQETNYFEKY